MKNKIIALVVFSCLLFKSYAQPVLVYHTIVTDSSGNLVSWYSPDPGTAYDHCLGLIWNFWNNIPTSGGTRFYMMDHSYSSTLAGNKVGGDQFAMALSSWGLYYAYTGDSTLLNNMKYIANTYLANSLSPDTAMWANLPYPSNYTTPTLPVYDGDYVLGAGVTEPDKAGSFAEELVTLYKITGDTTYLNAAVKIANTLAANVAAGDSLNSPFPLRVDALTGTVNNTFGGSNYTGDMVPTMRLFDDLTKLGIGDTAKYDSANTVIFNWVKQYPIRDNQWGAFFEDIPIASNTETNAVTMAWYLLEHPERDSTWQQDARGILDWTLATFMDTVWNSYGPNIYGATAIFEQSVDLKPGGSHTSRYASVELIYAQKTGDSSRVPEAIRQLDWATYLVDTSGQVRFSPSEGSVWYTDGYGDYVRHFLRGMAAWPAIAPSFANHLLGSTSVVTHINYQPLEISYNVYDSVSTETLRLTSKPAVVKLDGSDLSELTMLNAAGWVWTPYSTGGVVTIQHYTGHAIDILWDTTSAILSVTQNATSLFIYPNPASGSIFIHYTVANEQAVELALTDLSGKTIKTIKEKVSLADNTVEMDISNVSPGNYFVRLISNNGELVKKLVVVK